MEYLTVGFNPLAEPVGDTDALFDMGELPENAFRGVASVFGGIVDAYIPTIIHRGAFNKTLQESVRGIKILWQHDSHEPIGLPTSLFESDEGLVFQASVSRTTRGRDAITLMRDGVLDAVSIGFDSIKEDMEQVDDGSMVRHIREIRLWEISVVTFGADPNARIREVNSLPGAAIIKEQASINTGRLELQVVGRYLDLPLSDRSQEWNKAAAQNRVRTWADATEAPNNKSAKQFVQWDAPGDSHGDYRLPVADFLDGQLVAVPKAIFAAAAQVMKGTDLPEDELPKIQRHLGSYYRKMRKTFDDDSIVAPWELGEGAEPTTASLSMYSTDDRNFLVGQFLVAGTISPKVAMSILALDTEAESGNPLTPTPVDQLERQLQVAELAMADAFTATYPQGQ